MANNKQDTAPDDIFSKMGLSGILKTYDEVLAHYDFVINDLSSEIYNPVLRAGQSEVVAYLTAMRNEWQKCKDDVLRQLTERRSDPR